MRIKLVVRFSLISLLAVGALATGYDIYPVGRSNDNAAQFVVEASPYILDPAEDAWKTTRYMSGYIPVVGVSGEGQAENDGYNPWAPLLTQINELQLNIPPAIWISAAVLYVMLLVVMYKWSRQRQRRDESLRRSQVSLAEAQLITHVGNWDLDFGSNEARWSDETYHIFGLKPHEIVATPAAFLEFVHPDDRQLLSQHLGKAVIQGISYSLEHRILIPDGTERIVHSQAKTIFNNAGDPVRVIGTIQDITLRKETENELRLRNSELEALVKIVRTLAQPGTFEQRAQMVVEEMARVSQADAVVLRVPDEEGKYLRYVGWWADFDLDPLERLPIDGSFSGMAYKNGEIVETDQYKTDPRAYGWAREAGIESAVFLPIKAGGRVFGTIALTSVHQDHFIPGQVRLFGAIADSIGVFMDGARFQEQLQRAQKMDVVGQLAGGIAHDFNNLLTPMLGFATLASDELAGEHPVQGYLKEITAAAVRSATLIKQLMVFSRRQVVIRQPVDLNKTVRSTEQMLRRLIDENIYLVCLTAPEPSVVQADPGQIEQVLMNLAVNARDAMSNGGTLTIEVTNLRLSQETAKDYLDLRPGDYVRLTVTDTGTGMSEDVRSHLFEPFFTTKPPGKGTGLGLATCYGIVKDSGGSILVKSEPGKGSVFEVYLPRGTEPVQANEQETGEDSGEPLPTGDETILLVEDEPAVLTLAATTLRRQGYTVLEASDGEEAWEMVSKAAKDIDLLLTDVVMPRMGGIELQIRIETDFPELRVLFTSGYADEAVALSVGSERGLPFLAKPFTPATITRKIREVLDRKDGYYYKE